MTTHAEFTAGLRELADWYDAHPEIALPIAEMAVYSEPDTKERAAVVARTLGGFIQKEIIGTYLRLKRTFGPVELRFVFERDAVCVARVVRVDEIPEEVIPEHVIPAHTREIVEWDCQPILAPAPAEVP